jgi:hypothetical protein
VAGRFRQPADGHGKADRYIGVEQAKLIAQRTDVLVAPVLMAGQSPYHMEFPGTITLSSATIQQVYFEAAQRTIGSIALTRFPQNHRRPKNRINVANGSTAQALGRLGRDQPSLNDLLNAPRHRRA